MNEQLSRAPLGRGGPDVSRLCLGTMMFADQTGDDEAKRMLERYFSLGGNFVDTADSYSGGESERMLGRLMADKPDCFLATKVGNPVKGVEGSGGLTPDWIAKGAAMSLERLKRDHIDLYYLHLDDNRTPLDETIGALGDLLNAGHIRHWGFSNFRAWKIAEMVRVADRLGVARPLACQPYYHMLNRAAEAETLPACAHFGIGTVTYSPLGRGVLTGKYRNGTPEASRGARQDKRFMETEFRPETLESARRAADHAEASHREPVHLAINWLLANTAVTSVLMGPKSLSQLDAYLGSPASSYSAADETFLNTLCASGHTPAPGHSDPRYPFQGRQTAFAEA
ncbi:aldo/keto reductase [Pararhizobium haloflavum]|uniref:aldo/keto reductase n=1 Tax=Pararhizobium haloflavum TaxID=2037914 RepID=UPI000C19D086|nr:aldo/keto reductase [Pararhizobium haloflavum]